MEAFAIYLFKSACWLSGFALIYYVFLRNERFFPLIRFYLVAGVLISVLFPLISLHYPVDAPVTHPVSTVEPGSVTYDGGEVMQQPVAKLIDFRLFLLFVYGAGVLLFTARLILQATKLYRAINKANISKEGQVKLIRVSEFSDSFSFFNYVFINPSISETETREILNHELVHIKQKHWFDLLLIEILCLLQWANPFAWIYTRFIRLNHEYLADEVALQRTSDPAVYKATLVNQLFSTQVISLSNSFNYSLNQKRFEMMKKIITSPYRKLKVFLVLPVFAVIFYAFATPEYNYISPSSTAASEKQEVGKVKPENVKEFVSAKFDLSKGRPVIIVDGSAYIGDLDKILRDDIETMSVLKDNSASAVFGDKGKNGVLVITTKSKTLNVSTPAVPQKMVKGIVLKEDGKPLEGVQIFCTGTPGHTTGATTSADGRFAVNNLQDDAVLFFSCKGYKGQKIKAVFTSEMTIKMEKDPDYKGPDVKVGYGLIVVDDKVVEPATFESLQRNGFEAGTIKLLRGKEATDKYGEKGKDGVMEIISAKKAKELGIKVPFRRKNPEDFPTFKGGNMLTFQKWVADNTKYPQIAKQNGIKGRVYVGFSIQPDGSLSNISITGASDLSLGDAVLKTVQNSPKWEPAKNPEAREPFQTSVGIKFDLPDKVTEDDAFVVIEEMPSFPGGDVELLKFVRENIRYPEQAKKEGIQGRVVVKFVVNAEGKVEDVVVLKKVHPLLDAEAVRVTLSLPTFIPGKQSGVPRPVYYNMPITFMLDPMVPEKLTSNLAEMGSQTLFSKESLQKMFQLLFRNVIYPTDAREKSIEGSFYVIVKMAKGGIIENVTVNSDDNSINVPLLSRNEVIITAYKPAVKDTKVVSADIPKDPMSPLKNEAMRVAKMLETLKLPEWENKGMEFAIAFNFQLR
jgi:TonB family protein